MAAVKLQNLLTHHAHNRPLLKGDFAVWFFSRIQVSRSFHKHFNEARQFSLVTCSNRHLRGLTGALAPAPQAQPARRQQGQHAARLRQPPAASTQQPFSGQLSARFDHSGKELTVRQGLLQLNGASQQRPQQPVPLRLFRHFQRVTGYPRSVTTAHERLEVTLQEHWREQSP